VEHVSDAFAASVCHDDSDAAMMVGRVGQVPCY
jgi:hypothetical protein